VNHETHEEEESRQSQAQPKEAETEEVHPGLPGGHRGKGFRLAARMRMKGRGEAHPRPVVRARNRRRPSARNRVHDRAILDAAQIAAYFNFVNRLVLGLGVGLEAQRDGYEY